MNDLLTRLIEIWTETVFPTWNSLAPRLLGALVTSIVAIAAATCARWATRRAAQTEWLSRSLIRSGVLSGLVEPSLEDSRAFVANGIYFAVILGGALLSLAILSEQAADRIVSFVLVLLPNLCLALAIILAFWWLGRYWGRSTLIWVTNEGITHPWRWAAFVRIAVFAVGLALASESTGFATLLIRSSFLILLAGVTLVAVWAVSPMVQTHITSHWIEARDKAGKQPDDRLLS